MLLGLAQQKLGAVGARLLRPPLGVGNGALLFRVVHTATQLDGLGLRGRVYAQQLRGGLGQARLELRDARLGLAQRLLGLVQRRLQRGRLFGRLGEPVLEQAVVAGGLGGGRVLPRDRGLGRAERGGEARAARFERLGGGAKTKKGDEENDDRKRDGQKQTERLDMLIGWLYT